VTLGSDGRGDRVSPGLQRDHHLAVEVTMSTSRIVKESIPTVELSEEALAQQ
jgi:hypothetical protein